jgi:hypothetical protein
MICEPDHKLTMLINFVKKKGYDLKYMLFLSSCASVEYFLSVLKSLLPQVELYGLHGKMKSKRYVIFEKFRQSNSGENGEFLMYSVLVVQCLSTWYVFCRDAFVHGCDGARRRHTRSELGYSVRRTQFSIFVCASMWQNSAYRKCRVRINVANAQRRRVSKFYFAQSEGLGFWRRETISNVSEILQQILFAFAGCFKENKTNTVR